MIFSIQLIAAFLLDIAAGDPRWLYHPVRLIGWWCSVLERIARKNFLYLNLRLKGFLVVVFVVGAVLALLVLIFSIAGMISLYLQAILAFFLLYTGIAAGDLFKHSKEVEKLLSSGEIDEARLSVAMLVGRDTDDLDEAGISRACIESVSENMVDGITAPIFWGTVAAVLSPVIQADTLCAAVCGVYLYKSVNTMDSMFGYKNDLYMDFGWSAAKTDDILNFLPARLSGGLVVLAAFLLKMNCRESLKTFVRDRLNSSSPNSGHSEAAVAGALEVQLGGPGSYFGSILKKPFIGEEFRQPVGRDIKRANRLVLIASILFIISVLFIFNLIRYAVTT